MTDIFDSQGRRLILGKTVPHDDPRAPLQASSSPTTTTTATVVRCCSSSHPRPRWTSHCGCTGPSRATSPRIPTAYSPTR